MKLKYLSESTLEYIKYFEWTNTKKHNTLVITKKLTKPAAKELENLIFSFGGTEARWQTYEFSYNTKRDIDIACAYGYYNNSSDNVCLLPDSILKLMITPRHYLGDIASHHTVLVPFAGYGGIVKLLPVDTKVYVMYNQGLEELSDSSPGTLDQKYNHIFMRPPFNGKEDIKAITEFYGCLESGGELISFYKRNINMADSICLEFNRLIESVPHKIIKTDPLVWSKDESIDVNFISMIKE